ncbi:MAG: NADH:flavin oxidoreductase [Burkholderiaceae bacterium]|jgi:2,4-dienoyl-CoA reductase-like NADH-dependent reductase (Old Yellow Enzyme family)|nr:NADH:flavin oxidoreductase [Burkholderiaceae bacterium]
MNDSSNRKPSGAARLFEPVEIAGLRLANRVVMAPMTRSFSPGGVPGPDVAAYYRRRAEQDVGLIITEGTAVDRPAAANDPGVPHFHGEAALAGWEQVVASVHAVGGRIWPQLWHVGALRSGSGSWRPPQPFESPSGISRPGRESGVAMTEADVEATIAAFARAAADAKRLGFDGVELHGAHGYLIDQFFWEGSNQRTDRFGGATLAERTRFACEAIRAVRRATGPGFPICIRLSQWKQQDFPARLAHSPEEMASWLEPMVDAGVDVLHCSTRRFWEPEFEGSELNFAGWAKKLTGLPTITVGSVGLSGEFVASFGGERSEPASLDELLRRLDREEFDLVAVGRALIADADWARKVREGRFAELGAYDRSVLARLA